MSDDHARAATFAESYFASDPVMDAARTLASEYSAVPVPRSVAGLLEILAGSAGVRQAVEVGTGVGVSSLALLRGMSPLGVLTSIDVDPDRQAAAKDLITVARIKSHRFRTICGPGEDVLTRLAPNGYELAFIDTEPLRLELTVRRAVPLLAPGGLLIVHQALLRGAVANPANRDPRTQAVRTTLKWIARQDGLSRVLLPAGDGLLIARRTTA